MAFSTKYRSQFKDILNLLWKCDFELDPFTGSVSEMGPTGDPLFFEFLSASDDLHQDPIKGSRADFGIYAAEHFQYNEFYDANVMEIRCSIYFNSTLYWRGFILPGNHTEAYDGISYPVKLSASDGLGLLSSIPYKDGETTYTGRRSASQMIFDIISKIGFSQFTEYINVYEVNMADAVSHSPLDQYFIDQSIFLDFNCYNVLREILKKFNAVIKQKDGNFIIYDPTDLYLTTLYGRTFTSGTAKSSTSKSPEYFINRTIEPSDLRDIEGGNLGVKNGAKLITLNQDYGYKDSWIFNYKLPQASYNSTTENYNGWTHGIGWAKMSVAGENEGVCIYSTLANPPDYPWLSQSFGVYSLASSDVFIFSFDYKFINWSGSARSQTVFLRIKFDNGNHWLYNLSEEEAAWTGTEDDYEFTESVPVGRGDWNTHTRKITGIPHDGSYTISIYGMHGTAAVYLLVQNFRFYCTSDEIELNRRKKPAWWRNVLSLGQEKRDWKARQLVLNYTDNDEIVLKIITRTNAINGIDLTYESILGDVTDANVDNVLEQLGGSLAYREITGYTGATNKVVRVTKNSTDDDVYVLCNNYEVLMAWDTDEITTVTNFILSTPDFGGVTLIDNLNGSFDFSAASDYPIPEDDQCLDPSNLGSTAIISEYYIGDPVYTYYPTAVWNSRSPGGEAAELLEILADKLKLQFSRTRQILSLPFIETKTVNNLPHVDISGNFQDALNLYGSDHRLFAFSRGSFDVRNREWQMDLIEIIPIPEPE